MTREEWLFSLWFGIGLASGFGLTFGAAWCVRWLTRGVIRRVRAIRAARDFRQQLDTADITDRAERDQ